MYGLRPQEHVSPGQYKKMRRPFPRVLLFVIPVLFIIALVLATRGSSEENGIGMPDKEVNGDTLRNAFMMDGISDNNDNNNDLDPVNFEVESKEENSSELDTQNTGETQMEGNENNEDVSNEESEETEIADEINKVISETETETTKMGDSVQNGEIVETSDDQKSGNFEAPTTQVQDVDPTEGNAQALETQTTVAPMNLDLTNSGTAEGAVPNIAVVEMITTPAADIITNEEIELDAERMREAEKMADGKVELDGERMKEAEKMADGEITLDAERLKEAEKMAELQRRPKFNLNSRQPVIVSVTTQLSLKEAKQDSEDLDSTKLIEQSTTQDPVGTVTQRNVFDSQTANPGADPNSAITTVATVAESQQNITSVPLENTSVQTVGQNENAQMTDSETTTDVKALETQPNTQEMPLIVVDDSTNDQEQNADGFFTPVVDTITRDILESTPVDTTEQRPSTHIDTTGQRPIIVDDRNIERASIEIPVRTSVTLEDRTDPTNKEFVINRDSENPQSSPFTSEIEGEETENTPENNAEIFVAEPRV